jgi:multidrug efflux system outer membrane protein
MRQRPGDVFAAAVALAACCGCATQSPEVPAVATPSQWTAIQPPGQMVVTREWFREFGSPELDSLIASAYANSLDLQAADARLRQADARARAAGAAILPQVDLNADSTTYAGHSSNGSAHETDYGALISASYEIDFWGKNRDARLSAEASRKASEADRAVVALSAVTGVANTYFQVVALRERIALAQLNLDNARQLLGVVDARRSEGLGNPTEVAQQRAAVAGAEIHIKDLQQQQDAQLAALAILVGRMPGTLEIAAQHLSDLKNPGVSAGLPAELLSRRPDVFAAEENLRAAHADLAQARAAFFPSISLSASGGLQNPAVNAAVISLPGLGPSLTAGAALTQSIFNAGRLRAARDEAAAREEEMLTQYRAAALAALWDVETALSATGHLEQEQDAQRETVSQSDLALTGAQARYREGSGDFLTVLDAERTLYTARDQMSQYELARLQAVVGLCKALGGGWAQESR